MTKVLVILLAIIGLFVLTYAVLAFSVPRLMSTVDAEGVTITTKVAGLTIKPNYGYQTDQYNPQAQGYELDQGKW